MKMRRSMYQPISSDLAKGTLTAHRFTKSFIAFLVFLTIVASLFVFGHDNRIIGRLDVLMKTTNNKLAFSIDPVAKIKPGNRWIVVTSINYPTEDVKRLSTIPNWNLVVVGDMKTPSNWSLAGVHFLSLEFQKNLPFLTSTLLPFKSYTRKNIGYLYAISQGADWIYDTDDDNKPYGFGLEQFDYDEEVSGIRYQAKNEVVLSRRLFNPYRFFGRKDMWPRGFPLEYLKEHTNGNDRLVSCEKMRTPSIQQGLVQHDPDVDAIYRLQHADPETGLDEKFSRFAPPVVLSPGTYSPFNSQNTLFHKSAFHTLFLPTTVSSRTTDIWRSHYAQKILHMSGLTIGFTPTNAIQFRNPHDYLEDFENERQVHRDSGKILNLIDTWRCSDLKRGITSCMVELAKHFVEKDIWKSEDAELIEVFIRDLEKLGLEFLLLVDQNSSEVQYFPQTNESSREVNCRKININFEMASIKAADENIPLAREKIDYFGDIDDWCNKSGYNNTSLSFPSPKNLAGMHSKNSVLSAYSDTVLIITSNFEWKWGIGFLQRLYQPYFGYLVLCGSYYPEKYVKTELDFPPIISDSFNFVHINPAEMYDGRTGYHCMTLVKELRLNNVKGYFMMSDDMHFNIWQRIDLNQVYHIHGVGVNVPDKWWLLKDGLPRALEIIKYMKTTKNQKDLETWKEFEKRIRENGYLNGTQDAFYEMEFGTTKSFSDFYYIPSSEIGFYTDFMKILYKFQLFLEWAVSKYLKTVKFNSSKTSSSSYLWWSDRDDWYKIYNSTLIGMHPIKLSLFGKPNEWRKLYCSTVLQPWSDILFGGSKNFSMNDQLKT